MTGIDSSAFEPPTDVLAAEEFALPAPHPLLKPEHLELPTDLVGGEVRDVLAAEEFAIPAPDEAHEPPAAPEPRRAALMSSAAISLSAVLSVLWVLRRRRSR